MSLADLRYIHAKFFKIYRKKILFEIIRFQKDPYVYLRYNEAG